MVARPTPVPQNTQSLVQESYQSQGQPTQNRLTPTTVQAAITTRARRTGRWTSDQIPRSGRRNQAWILVRSARDQTAPAAIMARTGPGDRRARSPVRRAKVQKHDKKVSRAPKWAWAKLRGMVAIAKPAATPAARPHRRPATPATRPTKAAKVI